MARLQEAVRKITGQAWSIRVEAPQGAASTPKADEPEHSQPSYYRQRTEAGQEPLVKRAIEQLGAQILRVDEGFGTQDAAKMVCGFAFNDRAIACELFDEKPPAHAAILSCSLNGRKS